MKASNKTKLKLQKGNQSRNNLNFAFKSIKDNVTMNILILWFD